KYFVQKELDIRGSRNALPADFRAVIRYLQRVASSPEGNSSVLDALVSRVVTPDDAAEAMAEWAENPGKVFRILVKF
ncbi:MAG: sorbitol dehydrogenase, partial [Bacteroidaceae bacterium]|nr:sorbitol dehydrogenase [Bacteroidaceae bacterium]